VKITATINISGKQISQAWELIEDEDGSVLVINQLRNGGIIGIVLENSHIFELKDNEFAKMHYQKTLNLADAELIPRAG
jgi:hypothetical protein